MPVERLVEFPEILSAFEGYRPGVTESELAVAETATKTAVWDLVAPSLEGIGQAWPTIFLRAWRLDDKQKV